MTQQSWTNYRRFLSSGYMMMDMKSVFITVLL